jgi:hypothetical protein
MWCTAKASGQVFAKEMWISVWSVAACDAHSSGVGTKANAKQAACKGLGLAQCCVLARVMGF